MYTVLRHLQQSQAGKEANSSISQYSQNCKHYIPVLYTGGKIHKVYKKQYY